MKPTPKRQLQLQLAIELLKKVANSYMRDNKRVEATKVEKAIDMLQDLWRSDEREIN